MSKTDRNGLLTRLDSIERDEKLSATGRVLRSPLKRTLGLGYSKVLYPLLHRGLDVHATAFWDKKMAVRLPAGLDIFLTGAKVHSSELRLARYLIKRVTPGLTFFDVGAHFGFYSRLFLELAGTGRAFAFEPSVETHRILMKNVVDGMSVYQVAVSSADKPLRFVQHDIGLSEGNRVAGEHESCVDTVNAVALDSFCAKAGVKPDIIKMDVEGHEAEAVAGALNVIRAGKPDVVLEIFNPKLTSFTNQLQACDAMLDCGYGIFRIGADGEPVRKPDIESVFDENLESENVLFLPK